MKPFTSIAMLLACAVSPFLSSTHASPVMSCAHKTPSLLASLPASLPASRTPASMVQTPRSRPSATPTSASAVTAPAVAAGVLVLSDAPPPPAASITQAPNASDHKPCAKFVQTTYYSCVTLGTYTHCGWHEPILEASTSAAFGPARWSPALWCLAVAVVVFSCL